MKYHINPKTGNPGKCRATEGKCPFGSSDEHYPSAKEARDAYEAKAKAFSEKERSEPAGVYLFKDYKEDETHTYAKAKDLAKELKTKDNFVVIVTSYVAENFNDEMAPDFDDFQSEDDYDEAYAFWENSSFSISSNDEMAIVYEDGVRMYSAHAYDSKDAFENKIKFDGIPGPISNDSDPIWDGESNNSEIYRSATSDQAYGVYSRATYYEATPFSLED